SERKFPAELLSWRRIAAFLEDYFHLRFTAGHRIDFRFVGFIAVERNLKPMLAGTYQHVMKPASKIAAMTHVAVVDKNRRALGHNIQPQLGRVVARKGQFR